MNVLEILIKVLALTMIVISLVVIIDIETEIYKHENVKDTEEQKCFKRHLSYGIDPEVIVVKNGKCYVTIEHPYKLKEK